MSNYLVAFADGHATLFTDRAAAELAASYWPHRGPTIRDLDQEARDREEMIGLLIRAYEFPADEAMSFELYDAIGVLLDRPGRLP